MSIDYKVVKASDGTQFAEGRLAAPFSVPPGETVNAQSEVSLSFKGLGAVGKSLMVRGKTSYRVSGVMTVGFMGKDGSSITFPFSSEGEFALFDREAQQDGSGKK
eukprot:CAMPEP_0113566174 /NCGR_PEP_ID=MMETSP0015_2-20120614/22580_1 /TAXON_ID=2838 /ORGANISM="Odontella" /LENGTH=104 /DNA_ID=CAMNT_0000468441 /DNA_START=536 /DNA_END=850 /DNA_ORIENTATION=+ /assembly_acc=CAM_ASM_000160